MVGLSTVQLATLIHECRHRRARPFTQQSLRSQSPFRGSQSAGGPATLMAELCQWMTSDQKHYVRSSFSEGAIKLGISILQTAKQPHKAVQHGRYFGIPGTAKLQKDVLERALANTKVQDLLANRPSQIWPSLKQMAAMPKGSLGSVSYTHLTLPTKA